jgi:hypothetical protein
MKLRLGLLLLACGCLAACDSVVEHAREQVTGDYPTQTRTFNAPEKATYEAARAALKAMDFRYTHGGQRQGIIEAVSAITPGDTAGSSHQFALKANLQESLDGKTTDVTVSLTEIVEDDTQNHPGRGVENPLRDTSLYEVYFRNIQQNLPR